MSASKRRRSRVRAVLALLAGMAALVAGGAVAFASGVGREAEDSAASTTTTTSEPASSSSTTTTAAPTTTTTAPTHGGPTEATRPGDGGEQVQKLQARLFFLGYWLPAATGTYDSDTSHAVMAFQKQHGLQRDGIAGPATVAALATATRVAPTRGDGPHHEVSLADQVLVVVGADGVAQAVDATTGKASTPTPPGSFSIFRQVDAWDPGPYGSLYRPKYFTGGIAFHGGPPVIADPASHGCVRLPDPAVDWLWSSGLAPVGSHVVVY